MTSPFRDQPDDAAAVWLGGRDRKGKPFWIAAGDWDATFAEERTRHEERRKKAAPKPQRKKGT